MKIYAPVKDANGVWASVRFVNGVGETNNPALIEWFKKHNYRVEYDEPFDFGIKPLETKVVADKGKKPVETEPKGDVKVADEPDFESMSPLELRDWLKANGKGGSIKNIRDKEKLLKLVRGE